MFSLILRKERRRNKRIICYYNINKYLKHNQQQVTFFLLLFLLILREEEWWWWWFRKKKEKKRKERTHTHFSSSQLYWNYCYENDMKKADQIRKKIYTYIDASCICIMFPGRNPLLPDGLKCVWKCRGSGHLKREWSENERKMENGTGNGMDLVQPPPPPPQRQQYSVTRGKKINSTEQLLI